MATIKTNKLDYWPVETVSVTAAGFTSGATVMFELINLESDGILGTADGFSYNSRLVVDSSRPDSSACPARRSTRHFCSRPVRRVATACSALPPTSSR